MKVLWGWCEERVQLLCGRHRSQWLSRGRPPGERRVCSREAEEYGLKRVLEENQKTWGQSITLLTRSKRPRRFFRCGHWAVCETDLQTMWNLPCAGLAVCSIHLCFLAALGMEVLQPWVFIVCLPYLKLPRFALLCRLSVILGNERAQALARSHLVTTWLPAYP